MATPDDVRAALAIITGAAESEARAVAAKAVESGSPAIVRRAMFAAAPLIVREYIDGSAALAMDWYEAGRAATKVTTRFVPRPIAIVPDDGLMRDIAFATEPIYRIDTGAEKEKVLALVTQESLDLVGGVIQQYVAAGFSDTVTSNVRDDPDAVGWKRHANSGACKFCLMLAARGAVYTAATARFAAHPHCFCIAGPEFGGKEAWAEATPMQYLASSKNRTEKDRAALRDYLNKNYPDAPG